MQFSSYPFIMIFPPVALIGYFGLHHFDKERAARMFLTAMSLLFFAYGNPWYLVLLLINAVFNWWISRMFYRSGANDGNHPAQSPSFGKALLTIAIAANLGLLFYYKYFNFFIENLNLIFRQDLVLSKTLLPVGINFFTFQQIAWLVDFWCGEMGEYGFLDYVLFTVYFPKIAMDPILSYREFVPQLWDESRRNMNPEHMSKGLMVFAAGLFKKVTLAEFFASPVAWGHAQVEMLSSTDASLVMLAYAFRLYFDSNGYCDMVMGIPRMFNLELPPNFGSPYKALSPVDFWERWHMTLTRFLRTYIYFPLGRSRRGTVRTYVNIMIVFLASGLWHGANWTFILWGALHGAVQAPNRAFEKQWNQLHMAFQWMTTFLFVNTTWVIFRTDNISQAKQFLKQLVRLDNMQLSPGWLGSFRLVELPLAIQSHRVFCVVLIHATTLYLVMNTRNMGEAELKPTLLRNIGTVLLLVWLVISLTGISTFIYFQS